MVKAVFRTSDDNDWEVLIDSEKDVEETSMYWCITASSGMKFKFEKEKIKWVTMHTVVS